MTEKIRLAGFGGMDNELMEPGGSSGSQMVTVAPTDKGFQSQGCGTWTRK
jgi:hypothetical protein